MTNIDKKKLAILYSSQDIALIWNASLHQKVIAHPTKGKITPHQYRAQYHQRACPFCAQKMVHGPKYTTPKKQDAITRGYEYLTSQGKSVINRAGPPWLYFHPHYVTLDHKINKARCPERVFDYDNLQIMCWKCNSEKGDNNAYELQHNRAYIQALTQETLKRYPLL